MKILFAFLTVLCGCAAFSENLGKPINYTTPAVPLRIVLQELSKQSGVKFVAADNLTEEPLILRLNNVPLQDVIDKVADVFAADWQQKGDEYLLERSADKAAEVQQIAFAAKVEAVRQDIAAMVQESDAIPIDAKRADDLIAGFNQISKANNYDNAGVQGSYRNLVAGMPSNRFFLHELQSIDPAELAKIGSIDRAVFSSEPTAMQKPLRFDTNAAKEFLRSRDVMVSEYRRIVPAADREANPVQDTWVDTLTMPAKVTIEIDHRGSGNDRMSIDFTVDDKDGRGITQQHATVGADFRDYFSARLARDAATAKAATVGFDLGPVAKEVAPRIEWGYEGTLRPMPDQAITELLSPTAHDPLSFATSDVVLKSAELQNVNAICLADDDVEAKAYESSHGGKTSWDSFLLAVQPLEEMDFSVSDGWLVGKPLDPVWAAGSRIPRPLLEKILQDGWKDRHIGIEQAAELRGALPRDAGMTIASNQAMALVGDTGGEFITDPDLLKLLSTFSAAQWDTMLKGGMAGTVGDLTAEQQTIMSQLVYNSQGIIAATDHHYPPDDSLSQEITEILPSGLPTDARFSIADQREPTLFMASPSTEGSSNDRPVGDFDATMSVLLVQEAHPELIPAENKQPLSVALGERRLIQLDVGLSSKQVRSDFALDYRRGSGPSVAPSEVLKQLPDALRQKLIQHEQRYEDQRREEMKTEKGGKPPLW